MTTESKAGMPDLTAQFSRLGDLWQDYRHAVRNNARLEQLDAAYQRWADLRSDLEQETGQPIGRGQWAPLAFFPHKDRNFYP